MKVRSRMLVRPSAVAIALSFASSARTQDVVLTSAGPTQAQSDKPQKSMADEDRQLRQIAQRRHSKDMSPGSGQGDTQRPPEGLAGDWFGIRDRLERIGIVPTARYTSESAWNFRGGKKEDITENGQFDIGLRADLDKMIGLDGGTVQTTITYRRGHDLDLRAGLGTLQQVQEVYGRGQTVRLTQFWYEQTLGGDRVDLKVGRTSPGEDFSAFSCLFENLTFCGSQPGNLVGDYWYNWPISQWGGRARVNFGRFYVETAAYEANPHNLDKSFLNFHFHGATGALIPFEVGMVRGRRRGGTVGSYKIGGWINTQDAPDLLYDTAHHPLLLASDQPEQHSSRYGGYVAIEQQLTGRSENGKAVSGLTFFLNAVIADKQTSKTDSQIAGGIFYRGLIPWFTEDTVGVGFGRTHVSSRFAELEHLHGQERQKSEYEAEIFYGFHPLFFLELRPNLQWIHDAGGYSSRKDVGVFGMKAALTL